MKTIQLTQQEREDLYLCIVTRLGYVETGEVALRARDAKNAGWDNKIKALSRDQMELVIRLEGLMKKVF